MRSVLILGAGGHASVVADAVLQSGVELVGFLDDDERRHGTHKMKLPVLGGIDQHTRYPNVALFAAVGDNRARRAVVQRASGHPGPWARAIHPRAYVAPDAVIEQGTLVVAGAVVNPDTTIGSHVIVNTGATVDHDCQVGDFSHVAPGSHLGGGVQIGEGVLVGIGAVVLPGVTIGDDAVVGAGSVVRHDVLPGMTVKGVPAHP